MLSVKSKKLRVAGLLGYLGYVLKECRTLQVNKFKAQGKRLKDKEHGKKCKLKMQNCYVVRIHLARLCDNITK